MLRILKAIREMKDTSAVIHCSAGIGRTGTLMACEICLRMLLRGKELNVGFYKFKMIWFVGA
jgi:protein tyrosine phosphatase